MKSRIHLALVVTALSFGIVNLASAQTPQSCQSFCSKVRCAYPTTCGYYINANGVGTCGCH